MYPVRSCGSSERRIFAVLLALVEVLLDTDNELEAQASYLPAKARVGEMVVAMNTIDLLTNQALLLSRLQAMAGWLLTGWTYE
ncbi:MAG: hypothetical protein AAB830_00300 [Patescibacteria group bacterium]